MLPTRSAGLELDRSAVPHPRDVAAQGAKQPLGSDRGRDRGVDLDELPEVLIPSEVARLFRVDAKTVTRWANAGQIECFHTPGGHRRFTRAEVARLLEAGAG